MSISKKPLALALVTIAVSVVAVADAASTDNFRFRIPRHFRADLSGAQEVPAISTSARAEFQATLNAAETELAYVLSYSALEGGNPTAAHVHIGQPGANGGVMFFLCGGGSKDPCPPGPATVSGVVVAADVTGPTAQGIAPGEFAEAIKAMRSGITYANIHSQTWPAGEIRGLVRD